MIFISYRRGKSQNFASLLKHLLDHEYDIASETFLDQRTISTGDDFSNILLQNLNSCEIFVPIIKGNYLDEIEQRYLIEEPDYLLEELTRIYERRKSGDEVIIFPLRINDDFTESSIEDSKLPKNIKEVLHSYCMLNTEFVYSNTPNLKQFEVIVAEIYDTYQNLKVKHEKNGNLYEIVNDFTDSKNLKILFIGPTAAYRVSDIDRVKHSLIKSKTQAMGGMIPIKTSNALGNNLMKICEWYLSNSSHRVANNIIRDTLTNKKNYNNSFVDKIAASLDKFDIIVNFTLIPDFASVHGEKYERFRFVRKRKFKKRLRLAIDQLEKRSKNDKDSKGIYIDIQYILPRKLRQQGKGLELENRLLTSEDYLTFIKDISSKLDPIMDCIATSNPTCICLGVGELDLILKNLFIDSNEKQRMDDELTDYDSHKQNQRLILYAQDFDIIQHDFYIENEFQLYKVHFEQFLNKLD